MFIGKMDLKIYRVVICKTLVFIGPNCRMVKYSHYPFSIRGGYVWEGRAAREASVTRYLHSARVVRVRVPNIFPLNNGLTNINFERDALGPWLWYLPALKSWSLYLMFHLMLLLHLRLNHFVCIMYSRHWCRLHKCQVKYYF